MRISPVRTSARSWLARYLPPVLGKVATHVVCHAVAIVGYELRRASVVSGATR
jgi:hypothetical protein